MDSIFAPDHPSWPGVVRGAQSQVRGLRAQPAVLRQGQDNMRTWFPVIPALVSSRGKVVASLEQSTVSGKRDQGVARGSGDPPHSLARGGFAGQMQSLVDGVERQLQAVRDAELVEDVVQMILDRLLADEHLLGHLFVLVTLGDQS